jgi:hypothetical protein
MSCPCSAGLGPPDHAALPRDRVRRVEQPEIGGYIAITGVQAKRRHMRVNLV